MSDNYEFEKSSRPQDVDGYSPYMDKQYNGFINDLNGGVYTNTSLSLVQFDLGQIYNSQKFTDTNDMFMIIPITLVAGFAYNNGLLDPAAGNVNLLSMKSNFIHLIHQADLQINGKTIESTQPYINIAKHFQMLSEMSVNDLATIGYTLGFGENVDNHRSVAWNAAATTANGNGFTNNRVFGQNSSFSFSSPNVTGVKYVSPAGRYQTSMQANQNNGTVNDAITSKLSRYVDTTGGSGYNNILGTIINSTQLKNELRPTYEVNNKCMIWNDYAVIKLSTLFESLANIGLVRKFDCTLRLWLNTGTVNVTVSNPNVNLSTAAANAQLQYSLTTANNTFTNTCPFTVNYLNDLSANGGIPATTTSIVAGCYVGKPPTTTFAGVNLGVASVSGGLSTCRIYYSQIQIEPQKALTYVNENRNKKVVYRTILANQYNNQSGTFNQLINSGVVHPVGILIVPYIASSVSGFGDYQWKSPFDTCPATSAPISLTNLQVSVGGVNQLQSTLNYTFENFVEQINLAEALTSSDMGISCGLFSQSYWEMFRHYYVNIERSALTDKKMARNINISFQINSLVATDILTFIVYSDEFNIDIETGLITK
jgi:hypothetical protein